MKKRLQLILMLLFLSALLAGCSMKSGDELLKLPNAPNDYVRLQDKLEKIFATGAVYTSPVSGTNRYPAQFIDIDADGEEEAICFLRTSAGGNQFKVVLFKQIGSDYIEMGSIDGSGTAIESVHYPRVSENGGRGVIICWRLSGESSKGLTVCQFKNGKFFKVLDTNYSELFVGDIRSDSVDEVLTIVEDQRASRLLTRLYRVDGQTIKLASETPLSMDIKNIANIKTGSIADYEWAIIIDGDNKNKGYYTDILIDTDNGLQNITSSAISGISEGTYRRVDIRCTDINEDGITEIPILKLMPGYAENSFEEAQWMVLWQKCNKNGIFSIVKYTYHNLGQEWFFELPERWIGKVTASREYLNGLGYITFSEYKRGEKNTPLISIFALTGDSKEELAASSDYIRLAQTTTTVYVAKILKNSGDFSLTAEEIQKSFHLIRREWTAETE